MPKGSTWPASNPEVGSRTHRLQWAWQDSNRSGALWKDLERRRVGWANDREVPAIQRRQLYEPEPFSGCYDRGVDRPKWEIPIAGNELSDPDPVAGPNRFRNEVPCGEVAQEPHLGFDADAGLQQIGDLSDNELRNDERPLMTREQGQA